MTKNLIVYGTPVCPMVPPVIGTLKRAGVEHEYINIQADPAARERVLEINNGFASMPTLIFPDGETLTEPSARELLSALEKRGVEVAGGVQRVWAQHPAIPIVGGVFTLIGLSQGDWVLAGIGVVGLTIAVLARVTE